MGKNNISSSAFENEIYYEQPETASVPHPNQYFAVNLLLFLHLPCVHTYLYCNREFGCLVLITFMLKLISELCHLKGTLHLTELERKPLGRKTKFLVIVIFADNKDLNKFSGERMKKIQEQ